MHAYAGRCTVRTCSGPHASVTTLVEGSQKTNGTKAPQSCAKKVAVSCLIVEKYSSLVLYVRERVCCL
jgi:hypothetical protein